jgi:hypothetical protein
MSVSLQRILKIIFIEAHLWQRIKPLKGILKRTVVKTKER